MKKFLLSLLIVFGIFVTKPLNASAATYIQWWSNYDITGHVSVNYSHTRYSWYVSTGMATWNSYTRGVLQNANYTSFTDMTCSDYYNNTDRNNAQTSTFGTMKFNIFYMDGLNSANKLNVATHELGHTLGLGHNPNSSDLMYYKNNGVTVLKTDDKDSFILAYGLYS